MFKGIAICIVYIVMSFFFYYMLQSCVDQLNRNKEIRQYKHDAYVYEQGYIAGWSAKENGDIFDPEYYE